MSEQVEFRFNCGDPALPTCFGPADLLSTGFFKFSWDNTTVLVATAAHPLTPVDDQ